MHYKSLRKYFFYLGLVLVVTWVSWQILIRYQETRRWCDTQKAGGVPYFWKSHVSILRTLMNPPSSHYVVQDDNGKNQIKYIEAHGFAQDSNISAMKHLELRVICWGDSTTYGLVPNAQSFPALLERRLNVMANAPLWEVINGGRGGESTYTSFLRNKYVGINFPADFHVVGWFAGNEPVEMQRTGVYCGPRLHFTNQTWDVLGEENELLAKISVAEVQPWLNKLLDFCETKAVELKEPRSTKKNFFLQGIGSSGVLSCRYALYGTTSLITAFYYLRYEKGDLSKHKKQIEQAVVRTLGLIRAFKQQTHNQLAYVLIPEAYEVDPSLLQQNAEFHQILDILELKESDLEITSFMRAWMKALLQHEGVIWIDPLEEMRRISKNRPLFRQQDFHPTKVGNKAIANAIAKVLQSKFRD